MITGIRLQSYRDHYRLKYDCYTAAIEVVALIYETIITRPLWVEL